jgi:adhesin/invasin
MRLFAVLQACAATLGGRAGVAGACLALVVVGCERMQLLAPTASTITISAPARVLPLGGSTQVSAVVIEEAGTPVHNGTTVRFTSSLGRLEPAEAQTRNGVATTTFFAGDVSGVAAIRAMSGGAAAEDGSNVLEITLGAAAASAVVLSANPSTVPATGGTVTLTASVVDVSGNRMSNVPVSFSTTAGTLSASSAVTSASGDAVVQLTTDRAATVTARVGAQTATASIAVATPPGITLAVSPASPSAGVPMLLTITVNVAAGNPVPRVTVDWGDGSAVEDLGIVGGARGVSHTYNAAGTYVIGVSATADGNTTSTATTVTVVP